LSPVDAKWDESQPIYRQLRDRVVAMMLEGVLKEGEAIPSVRQVATEYRVNPLTVLKAYQALADEGLVEKRRGLGMFVAPGASAALMKDERERFLATEWPKVQATIQRLGLSATDLLNSQTPAPATPPLPTARSQE
jgi:GntR family transcriptional regulator